MAIKPKQVIDTAMGLGQAAVTRGVKLAGQLRKDEPVAPPTTPATPAAKTTPGRARATSGAPATVGAPKPGEPGGPKSATTTKSKPKAAATKKRTATKAKPKPAAKTKARAN